MGSCLLVSIFPASTCFLNGHFDFVVAAVTCPSFTEGHGYLVIPFRASSNIPLPTLEIYSNAYRFASVLLGLDIVSALIANPLTNPKEQPAVAARVRIDGAPPSNSGWRL